MALSVNTIKGSKNSSRKRIGRGNGSNKGNYSGRGIKGQKARSGTSGLKLLGLKSLIGQTPKKRGFTSPKAAAQEVALFYLNDNFKEGDSITPESLEKAGLVKTRHQPIKILQKGSLEISGLSFKGVKISSGAAEQIKKKKGKIE